MKAGTKLYKVCNGNLEVVKFIREQIVDGATLVTYTVQNCKDGRKINVATDYYQEKEIDAWNLYIDDLILDIQAQNQVIREAHIHLSDLEHSLLKCISGLRQYIEQSDKASRCSGKR